MDEIIVGEVDIFETVERRNVWVDPSHEVCVSVEIFETSEPIQV